MGRAAVVGAAYVAQAVVLVPFTVASGLLAPLWAVIALHALWAVALVALVQVARTRPFAAPLVPATNALLLWLAITAGELLLGWTG